MIKKIRDSKGFMSIEAVLSMSAILMVILLAIGFFTYMMPRQGIEQEVNLLGRMAKMNGGIHLTDKNAFIAEMEKRGYKKEEVKIGVVLKNINGTPVSSSVTPLNIGCKANLPSCTSKNYVKRGDQLIMEIRVELPANKQGLLGAFSLMGSDKSAVSDTYVFKERVMSERI